MLGKIFKCLPNVMLISLIPGTRMGWRSWRGGGGRGGAVVGGEGEGVMGGKHCKIVNPPTILRDRLGS